MRRLSGRSALAHLPLRFRGALASLLLVLLSSPAFACAVCGGGYDPAKGSYVVMSVIISLLPLLMLGGILAWVIVSVRAADREAEQPDSSPPESVKS